MNRLAGEILVLHVLVVFMDDIVSTSSCYDYYNLTKVQ